MEAYSDAFVSASAFLLAFPVMAMRQPPRSSYNRKIVFDRAKLNSGQLLYTADNRNIALSDLSFHSACRDNPMTGALGARPLRDKAGRFVKPS